MQRYIIFPEEHLLVVRPSLVAICAGQHAAAKLLSVLLYRCDRPQTCSDEAHYEQTGKQEIVGYLTQTQAQLVADLCGELSDKTLQQVAIPTLQLLGYLDLDETGVIHRYMVYLERIRTALQAYAQGPTHLRQILERQLQEGKSRLDALAEHVPFKAKKFQREGEKLLASIRTFSCVENRLKTASEEGSGGFLGTPQNQREIQERRREKVATVSFPDDSCPDRLKKKVATVSQTNPGLSTPPSGNPAPSLAQDDRSTQQARGAFPRCQSSDLLATKHGVVAPCLTPRGRQVWEWYEAIRQVKLRPTAENICASNGLGEMEEVTRENLEAVMMLLDHDPWLQARNLVVDLQELESASSKFRFERVLLAVKRRQQPTQPQIPSPGGRECSVMPVPLPDYTHVQLDDLYIRA